MKRMFDRGVVCRMRWFLILFLICATQGYAAEKKLHFTFQPDQVEMETVGLFHQLRLKDGDSPSGTHGHPDLPCQYVNILLPPGAVPVNVKATVDETVLAKNILVYPSQPPRPLSDHSPVVFVPPFMEAYDATEKVPQQTVVMGDRQTMRGYTYLTVRLNPVRYLPAEKRLYLVTNLNLTVYYEVPYQPSSVTLAPASSAKSSELFAGIVGELVVNPQDITSSTPTFRPLGDAPLSIVDYLIVTSPALSNSFQKLADYRTEQDGLSTKVLTTNYIDVTYSGVDIQEKMKHCVEDYYENNALTYLVIGGDNTIVEDRDCYVTCSTYTETEMPTDLYFSGLDSSWDENGNGVYGEANYSEFSDEGDLAFDVIVGRIPVRTTVDFDNYFGKLTNFETNPPPSSFYRKMIFLGEELWNSYSGGSRPSDVMDDGCSEFQEHEPVSDAEIWQRRKYKEEILPYWEASTEYGLFFDSLTSWDSGTAGDYLQSAANVSTRFNEGWYFVNMDTHGNTTSWGLEGGGFYSSSASALTGMTAIVCTEACITGSFDKITDPCLSEAFLRNGQGGAIAYMGCSRYGWGSPGSWDGGPSTQYVKAFYEKIFEDEVRSIGQAFAASKAAMAGGCGSNGSSRWIQFGLNFQGDPAIQIRTMKTPPIAENASPFAFKNVATNLVLQAEDEGEPKPPGVLSFIITSLPSSGTLSDPGAGSIVSVPYTLSGNGNTVTYASDVTGADNFTFIANDGGALPEGGDSNIATVDVSVVSGLLSLSASSYSVNETNGTLQIDVLRTGCDTGLVSVDFSTADGTAEAGLDYVATNGTLTLPDGVSSGSFTIEIIDDLSMEDKETLNLVLSNPTGGAALTSPDSASVSILSDDGLIAAIYMDTDPGWTEEGLWDFGQPTGGEGSSGSPDPIAGFTGDHVVGYNLNGDYEDNLSVQYLTSTAFDCSRYTNVTLKFKRWLGIESSSYDHANLQISTNGTTWSTVWEHSGSSLLGGEWVPCQYDISSIADRQFVVYLRWGMGATDPSATYCGWNIDDVELFGIVSAGIEVDRTELDVPEGSTNGFNLRLLSAPASTVTVIVSNVSGDSDITVYSGASLEFTSENWSDYQSVVLAAAEDTDWVNSSAVIRCSSPSMTDRDITANEVENDTNPALLLPFSESFENNSTNAGVLGDLDGQHGWIAEAGAIVQTETSHTGSQALRLQDATASHTFLGAQDDVAVEFHAKFVRGAATPSDTGTAVAIFNIDTNGYLVAYSNETPIILSGTTLSDDWHSFKAQLNYTNQTWDMEVDDELLVENFAFYSAQSAFQKIVFQSGSQAAFLDEIYVANHQESGGDTDSDGIPDTWEDIYYGGATNAVATNLCANGVNTIFEAYVAGLNPTNAASVFGMTQLESDAGDLDRTVLRWNFVSNRHYTVYWTSNLLNGFSDVPMASNITAGAFTDIVHEAANDGFYRIEVDLAP